MFVRAKVAVFADGDFWDGWRFPRWRHELGPYWRKKVEGSRYRDRRTPNRLRRKGWLVIRIWEHDAQWNAESGADCIEETVRKRAERSCH